MSENQTNDELVEQILIELGTLLRMRIDAYVNEHYRGNKFRFVNDFIVFPVGEYSKHDSECYDLICDPLDKANQLNSYISISIAVSVSAVYLDDDGNLKCDFHWSDYGLGVDDDADIDWGFTLLKTGIQMPEIYKKKFLNLKKETLEIVLGELKMDLYR
jgi:hypothetical protein